jgi:hypothetical protein
MAENDKRARIITHILQADAHLSRRVQLTREANAEWIIRSRGITDPAERAEIRRLYRHLPPDKYRLLSPEHILRGPTPRSLPGRTS